MSTTFEELERFLRDRSSYPESVDQVLALAELFSRRAKEPNSVVPRRDIRALYGLVKNLFSMPLLNVVLVESHMPEVACARMSLTTPRSEEPQHLWQTLFHACFTEEGHSLDVLLLNAYERMQAQTALAKNRDRETLLRELATLWRPSTFFLERLMERARVRLGADHWLITSGKLQETVDYYARHLFPIILWAGLWGQESMLNSLIPLAELMPEVLPLGLVRRYALALKLF